MTEANPFRRIRKLVGTAVYKLTSSFELWLIRKSCLGRIGGIAICDNSMVQQNRDNFLSLTRQAMALIQSLDPRRYRRVCRHLEYIVNMELISGGNFARRFKICHVDYSRFLSADPLWNLRHYAQLLVHEATHGLLFDKGILYDKESRERVERLCRLEEYRFAQNFESGYAETSVQPFDSEWYEKYWDDKVRRGAEWKRLWEAIKASRAAAKAAKSGIIIQPVPTDAKTYNKMGESCRDKGDNTRAISYFSHAIQLDPQFAIAYYNRGYVYHDQGEYAKAIVDYDNAIQIDPNYAKAFSNRGLTYRFRGEYDKAIADYDRAIQLDPQFTLAYNNRGYAYHCKGQYGEAVADFDQAMQIDPKLTLAYINRGRTHRTTGNYEKAIADYTQLIELAPKYASAYNNLAWILATCPQAALRDGKRAVENAMKACELSEWKNSSALNTLALACGEVGDFENAAKWQSQYLKTPGLSASDTENAKGRLERYQARKPITRIV